MNTSLLFFLAGLFVGWLIEWVIDWFFWRRNAARIDKSDSALRAELDAVQEHLAAAQQRQAEAEALQRQLASAQSQVDALKQERDALARQLDAATAATESAESTAVVEEGATRTSVTLLDADAGAQPLAKADAATVALQQELDVLRHERDALYVELNKSRFAGAAALYVVRDDLEQIDGVGPVYEERLYAGGVETFGQLAAQTPAQLADIVQAPAGQVIDFDRWIAQARGFADLLNVGLLSNDLEEINGIGPVYAKRLRAAGIKTFEDLAACTTDQLADIVGKGRTADYESWISQAKVYAAITSGRRAPSDLERIKGIGPIFSARLELAGVTTFDALSQLSEESLHQIIGSKGWALVHHDRWMTQARQLAKLEAGA